MPPGSDTPNSLQPSSAPRSSAFSRLAGSPRYTLVEHVQQAIAPSPRKNFSWHPLLVSLTGGVSLTKKSGPFWGRFLLRVLICTLSTLITVLTSKSTNRQEQPARSVSRRENILNLLLGKVRDTAFARTSKIPPADLLQSLGGPATAVSPLRFDGKRHNNPTSAGF